ncbi:hypothetical protein [Aureibacter tunicatorum]|uniref:Uncharacterized protein n=1 Tax=Aureibacter tunicatorum TaxID=866807 RepID=A0AAE3XLX0_9BACT|nr:hypothetical protein [Aureibacter tunicatorum]MDR6240336.1 hypothetical protein [Aureibacter tunicatorum]BDD05783.1 hypothetical protein AUTU_32660 [Aureibacter tunicatorum]
MGLFDKLKQAANFVTGGGATISVRTEESVNNGNEPIKFIIDAVVKGADMNARNVYLKIRAAEKVKVVGVSVPNGDGGYARRDFSGHHETFETEIQATGAQTLEANQTYQWIVEWQAPVNVNGTYHGENAVHEWEMYAGIDVSGNDPDSNWQPFELYF